MDERESAIWKRDQNKKNIGSMTTGTRQLMYIAEYVIVLKDETYEIIKDRSGGEAGLELPLNELPDVIKQRLIQKLKFRDQISTDE